MKKNFYFLIIFLIIGFFAFSCKQSVGGGTGTEIPTVSSGVVITVKPATPIITGQPQSFSVKSAETFKLSCFAVTEDAGDLSYQWHKKTGSSYEAISGETSKTLEVTAETLAQDAADVITSYYCTVTNTLDSKTVSLASEKVNITVTNEAIAPIPNISTQPVDFFDEPDSSTELLIKNHKLSVAISSSTGTLSYQWFKADDLTSTGEVITGADKSSYTADFAGDSYYWCKITSTVDELSQSIISNKVNVKVLTGLGYTHPTIKESIDYSPLSNSGTKGNIYNWKAANYALGSTIVSSTYTTFAVYSKNATKMLLEIYDDNRGSDAKYDYWMEKGSDDIWRAAIIGNLSGKIYAFRAWGPNWPFDKAWTRGNSSKGFIADYDSKGNRFNPNKVLFDPYAKELTHDRSGDLVSGISASIYTSGSENRNTDTGKVAPKAYIISDSTNFGTKPNIAAKDAIIYEAHVRGLTNHSSSTSLKTILNGFDGFGSVANIPEDKRGTYAGAALMAPYLKALGITTIELLPVQESDNDANPNNRSGGNYWAYMTYGYFAPDRRYSSDKTAGGPTREFKEMVSAFHDAGMEVYLDVVYNHSGEGGTWNGSADNFEKVELTFMRGLDNSTYYSLVPKSVGSYWETSGCGNNLQCDNATVRKLILDSLKYWTEEMGVDGFRFDLAPVLGRVFDSSTNNWKFDNTAQTLTDIATYGNSKNVEMIAEAWDCGDGYSVGNFPNHWGDWNGKFRDETRRFLKNEAVDIRESFNGSPSMYDDVDGDSANSINLLVAHDGLTLTDLVSYPIYNSAAKAKYNMQSWPFGSSDGGSDDNKCWDSVGYESKSWFTDGNYNVEAFRRQRLRNFFVFQTFARGVPMIVYGDEFGRTQNGNNNPYNLDSVATWNNYNFINTDTPHAVSTGGGGSYNNKLGTDAKTDNKNNIFLFTKSMFALRNGDSVLRQNNYTNVKYDFKLQNGDPFSSEKNSSVRITITESGSPTYKYCLCISRNEDGALTFTLPKQTGHKWVKIVDTSFAAESNNNVWTTAAGAVVDVDTLQIDICPQSIAVFQAVEDNSIVYVENPTFSKPSQGITSNLDLTISSTSGSTIYYTVDGTDPTTSGTRSEYTSSITISETTTVKAVAYKDGKYSDVVYAIYTLLKTVYFYNDQGWTTVNAYAWNENGPLSSWPGTAMTEDSGNWYKINVSLDYPKIIFNNGSTQTDDLTWTEDKPYFKITGASGDKKTGEWSSTK